MPTITIQTFSGETPRTTPRLLDAAQATVAINCQLERGHLEPLAGPGFIAGLDGSCRTIYKHEQDGWLGFKNACNVVKSIVPDSDGDEPLGQLFITGDRAYPTQYLAGGKTCRLGIPRPPAPPEIRIEPKTQEEMSLCAAWGSQHAEIAPARYGHIWFLNPLNTAEKDTSRCMGQAWPDDFACGPCAISSLAWAREWEPELITDCRKSRASAYCYTWVRSLADGRIMQESAPSPPTQVIDVPDGHGVFISGIATCDLPESEVSHVRIYRAVSGVEGAEFRFLKEIALPCSGYLDTVADRDVSAEVLLTSTWDCIPDDAQGLISLESGIYAAFRGNELLLSEPFHAYAFPCAYRVTLKDRIIWLGRMDNGIAILTGGRPYIAQGTDPSRMQFMRLELEQGCVAALSSVQTETGVFYASPDGLVSLGSGGSGLATGQIFTRRQWQHLRPESILGAWLDGKYIVFFYGTNRGFILDSEGAGIVRIELEKGMKVLGLLRHSVDDCVYLSIEQDGRGSVWKWMAGKPLRYRWRSKPFFTSRLCSMRSVRIEGEQSPRMRAQVNIFGPDLRRPRQILRLENTNTKRIQSMRAEKLWTLELEGFATIYEARLGTGVEDLEYGN